MQFSYTTDKAFYDSLFTIYSIVICHIAGALELLLPKDSFNEWGVFSHGGIIFLLTTSAIFTLVYSAVYLLPYTRISNVISIPAKPSFYRYTLVLFCSCLAQTVGCALILSEVTGGYCLVNLSHYLYFTFFIPLVYLIFLNDYCYQPTKIPFSYTMNESMYEDNVNSIESVGTFVDDDDSFMHQGGVGTSGCSREGGMMIGAVPGGSHGDLLSNANNNFVLNGPVNPNHHQQHFKGTRSPEQVNYHRFLYNTNIQSPGSLTGYSSVEESTTATVSAHGSMEFIQQQQVHRQGESGGGGPEEQDGTK